MDLGLPPNLSAQLKSLLPRLQPLLRHLPFAVTVGLLGFLIFVVYQVTQILAQPTDEEYAAQAQQASVQTHFDQATINQIKNLRSSSQDPNNLKFGASRTRSSPFRE